MADVAMADTNGLESPTPQSLNELTTSTNNQSTKRKREEGEESHEHAKGAEENKMAESDGKDSWDVQRLIEDIVEILKRYNSAFPSGVLDKRLELCNNRKLLKAFLKGLL